MHINDTNKKTWHYRIVEWESNFYDLHNKPKNFCAYWRRFIIGIVTLLFFGSLLSIPVLGLLKSIWADPVSALYVAIGIVAFIGLLILIFYVFGHLLPKYNKKYKERMEEDPSIFYVRAKSWKEKICPNITYESEK